MNDFFIRTFAQNVGDLAGSQPFDAGEVLVAVVGQPAGNLRSVGAAEGHDVSFGKQSADFHDPRCQQAAPFPLYCLLGSGFLVQ